MKTWLQSDKIRVLLVEDDEDDYILTSSLLSEIYPGKFEPTWARSYEEGMERIFNERFDVCLLDYRLGQHNGVEILREARERGYDNPMILLTGQSDPQLDFEAMRAGASDYLVKSQINASNLERSIRYSIQQKQMEYQRIKSIREQEARTQAEAANRAKDEFLAMVSHELRTPLNAMLGWVGILRSNKGDEGVYERAIDAIDRSAKAQNRLVNDLLDISRIASGNLSIEKQPVNLTSVIEPVIEAAFPAADKKSITLETDLERSVRWVSGDPNRLQQVVNNLVQNAIKFTPEGGRISVTLSYEGDEAKVNVTDTGKGIPGDFLPHVFDRYRQGRGAGHGKTGLGLGLAIARHIVDLHGGTISADSDGEGRGATFSIVLPLTTAEAAAPA
jgi:signal transduction histidine kinase